MIYCYFNDFTVDNISLPCPNYAFKLAVDHSFSVGNFSHKFRQQNETIAPKDGLIGNQSESEIEIDELYVENNKLLTEYAKILYSLKTETHSSSSIVNTTLIFLGFVLTILVAAASYKIYQNIDKVKKFLNRREVASAPLYTTIKPTIPPRDPGNVAKGEC